MGPLRTPSATSPLACCTCLVRSNMLLGLLGGSEAIRSMLIISKDSVDVAVFWESMDPVGVDLVAWRCPQNHGSRRTTERWAQRNLVELQTPSVLSLTRL